MTLDYELWDVFTDRPLAGNALAVVPDAEGLDDAAMQAIAGEFNLSETSFVLPSARADVRARYFTPRRELPMAGHPTIGTVFALERAGRAAGDALTLELGVGPTPVRLEREDGRLARAWMDQGAPRTLTAELDREGAARALGLDEGALAAGLPVEVGSAGVPFLLVPLADRDTLGRARPERAALAALVPPEHRFVLAFVPPDDGGEVRCRMFAEEGGIAEDPATGSAHGPLGAYLWRHGRLRAEGGEARFVSRQGVEMGRPSELRVRVRAGGGDGAEGPRVEVGGHAVRVGAGRLELP